MRDRIREELKGLAEQGSQLLKDLSSKDASNFRRDYQTWYTRALAVVQQLIPERLDEFTKLYYDKDVAYTIARYLRGGYTVNTARDARVGACNRFLQQYLILESAQIRLDDILTNIYGLLQAEILDSELDAATELHKAGHVRAGGTVAGVVLERHLAKVCSSRSLACHKKNPTISDWNDILKDANAYDIPTWRGIQRLTDIRNLCAHPKDRDPTKEEVDELIRGVERITKTIF
jgi:hypothetical protein